ncbi:hypothetical protein Tco_0776001 [Tanacetum coccineum]
MKWAWKVWKKSFLLSGKWAAKRKQMMRVGPLVLSLDGKLLGTIRMTKKINVHPERKTLQTLTNGAKRKLDYLHLSLAKKDDKEDQCTSQCEALQIITMNWRGCKKKTNDESGTLRSQSGWKTSWDKRHDKKIKCIPSDTTL